MTVSRRERRGASRMWIRRAVGEGRDEEVEIGNRTGTVFRVQAYPLTQEIGRQP